MDNDPPRSWHWLINRLLQLLAVPPSFLVVGKRVVTVHQTRFGHAIHPPRFDDS